MYVAATIPEDVAERLRLGARRVGIERLISLSEVVEQGCDEQSERGGMLRARFARACDLLDVIGWGPGEAGPEVMVDVDDHRLALYESLIGAVRLALCEIRSTDAMTRARTRKGVLALSAFASLLRSASVMLGGHDRRLSTLEHQAGDLLADLEDEAEESCYDAVADALAREREDDRSHANRCGC